MAERKILEANTSFAVYLDGVPFSVVAGDRFYSDDPVVKGREGSFGEITVRSSTAPVSSTRSGPPQPAGDVETADATPGSRRSRTTSKGVRDA